MPEETEATDAFPNRRTTGFHSCPLKQYLGMYTGHFSTEYHSLRGQDYTMPAISQTFPHLLLRPRGCIWHRFLGESRYT